MSADRHGLDQTQRNADWLSGKLTALNGCAVPVTPVLVLPGWWVEAKGKGSVSVLNPKSLRSFLNSRAPTLSAERQRASQPNWKNAAASIFPCPPEITFAGL